MVYFTYQLVEEHSTIMNDILKEIGLTENEAKVYSGLLSAPNTSAAKLAKRLKMDKSSTYNAIETLMKKSLVVRTGYSHGTTYNASNPKTLLSLISKQEAEIKARKEILSDYIQKIELEKLKERETYVTIDKGIVGLINAFELSLNSKEKLIRECFQHHTISNDPAYIKFIEKFARERVKRKIHMRELQTPDDREKGTKVFGKIMINLKKYLKEQRDMPKGFDTFNSFRVWDNTVEFLSYDNTNEFILLTIKDDYISSLMKSIYDYIWENSK